MIPDYDFITSMLNISQSDIENCKVFSKDESVFYEITLKRKPMKCPVCNCQMIGHGHKRKTINHPILRDHHGVIIYNSNRYICKSCGKTALEQSPFSYEGFNSSFFLLQSVMKQLANLNLTLETISKDLNISKTQINKYLDSYITIPPRPLPVSIGIDELHSPILSKHNASYLCILVDNNKRCIYEVLDSRGKYYLQDYVSQFSREERYETKYVTIDMWEPYRDIANIYFPKAIVAVDPFHVIEHLCKDFSILRVNTMKKCEYNSNEYYLLKKWHWLMEKDNVFLDNERHYNSRFGVKLNRRDIFNMIKEAFPDLYLAYYLKEAYRKFNKETAYEDAVDVFDQYVDAFKNSGIKEYDEFIGILTSWKTEILNSFKRPTDNRKLSNSLTENINGKLRSYITVSRGISNFTRFRKRVLYALNPEIMYALTNHLYSDKRKGNPRGSYDKTKE